MNNDQPTSKRRLTLTSIAVGILIGSLGTLLGIAALDRFSERLEHLPGATHAGIDKHTFDGPLQNAASSAAQQTTSSAALIGQPNSASGDIAFDCQQTSTSRSGNVERLTLVFNSGDQTLTLGSIVGLPFERIKKRIHFSYAPGYLAENQFIDDYIFEPTSGRLTQRVKIPSIASAGVQNADNDGYTTIYSAKYFCTRKRLRK
tara:strand:- start:896 stop:1504 length:609 start_codon:yes stop_codon:yes gene_type:complete